jgi:hypothetical protein
MAVYEKEASTNLKQAEVHLYGSSRLGIWNRNLFPPSVSAAPLVTVPAQVCRDWVGVQAGDIGQLRRTFDYT